jgi:hypothetical protein
MSICILLMFVLVILLITSRYKLDVYVILEEFILIINKGNLFSRLHTLNCETIFLHLSFLTLRLRKRDCRHLIKFTLL